MYLQDILLIVAVATTLLGVWARSRLTSYCEAAEEGVKNHDLTPEQARTRVALMRHGSHAITFIGLVLLLFVAADLLD